MLLEIKHKKKWANRDKTGKKTYDICKPYVGHIGCVYISEPMQAMTQKHGFEKTKKQ